MAHREYGLGNDFFALRIDIRKYFDSIDHEALKEIAKRVIKDPQIYELCSYLIDTFSFKLTKDKHPIPANSIILLKAKNIYLRISSLSGRITNIMSVKLKVSD